MKIANTPSPLRGLVRAGYAAAAMLLAVTLAGCMKFQTDLTLHDDRVDGSIIVALDRQVIELFEQLGEEFGDESMGDPLEEFRQEFDAGAFEGVEGVTVEPYESDTHVGTRIILRNTPIEEFANDETLAITYDEEAGIYEVTGLWDMGEAGFDEFDPDDPSLAEAEAGLGLPPGTFAQMIAGFDISISITFPGEVIEHNGVQNGNTVTWVIPFEGSTEIHAKASATGGSDSGPGGGLNLPGLGGSSGSGSGGESGSNNAMLIAVIAGLGCLVLLVGVGLLLWLLLRKKPAPAVAGQPMPAQAVPTQAMPTQPMPGVPTQTAPATAPEQQAAAPEQAAPPTGGDTPPAAPPQAQQ